MIKSLKEKGDNTWLQLSTIHVNKAYTLCDFKNGYIANYAIIVYGQ